jgi:aspartyl-tRNA(Asn)/glutamyl-tRNA(Gln) amidotransferase subunit A
VSREDLGEWSAAALAAAIRARDVTATAVVTAALKRTRRINPALNAVASLDREEALAAAHALDTALDRGQTPGGPLLGVPLAHKDMFARTGRIATWGAKIQATTPATNDASVIARLKAAGSIPFAALAMSEFAFGITGHNLHFGHCHNPHAPDHIPGGSSSGAAAAVAAGLVPFALGSDTAGSIRVPAACCGIAGLRPTWGLISRAGAMPLAPSLDTVGILARDVEDIALALDVVAGADPADATAFAPPPGVRAAKPVAGLAVGVDRALFDRIDPAVAALLSAALEVLIDAGAHEVPVHLPDLRELDRFAQLLQCAEATAHHAVWMRDRPQDYSDQVRTRLQDGYTIAAVDYLQALRARPLVSGDWLHGPLGQADVLFLPVLSGPVPTLAESDAGAGPAMATVIGGLLHFTRPISYLGLPCLALPTGRDPAGLPNGFQLVGRPFAEPTLLALGKAYQRRVGVPKPVVPPLSSGDATPPG